MNDPLASDRLRKVRALLAKAEETNFPDEATTYLSKAAALVSKWELDEAMVWADTPEQERSAPITRTVDVTAPYANRKTGFGHDVEVTELLFSSLLVQMTRAMLADESRQPTPTATAQWRRSFIVAFSNRVDERLQSARHTAGVEHDRVAGASQPSAALVLIDRSKRVDEETRRQFPRLRSSRISSVSTRPPSVPAIEPSWADI